QTCRRRRTIWVAPAPARSRARLPRPTRGPSVELEAPPAPALGAPPGMTAAGSAVAATLAATTGVVRILAAGVAAAGVVAAGAALGVTAVEASDASRASMLLDAV